MSVLSEFPLEYENDEEITKAEDTEGTRLYIGSSGSDIIIGQLSRITNRIRGVLLVEKQNLLFIGESIDELLDREKPWEESIKLESGKDKLLIYYSNSWAHNLPAPFERVNVENSGRNYELDNLRSRDIWLSLPPKMAQKLADEIQRLFG